MVVSCSRNHTESLSAACSFSRTSTGAPAAIPPPAPALPPSSLPPAYAASSSRSRCTSAAAAAAAQLSGEMVQRGTRI